MSYRIDPLETKYPVATGLLIVITVIAVLMSVPGLTSVFGDYQFQHRVRLGALFGAVVGVLMWRRIRLRQGRGTTVDRAFLAPLSFLRERRRSRVKV